MPTKDSFIEHRFGTSEVFDLVEKDPNSLYFLTDKKEIYLGDQKYVTKTPDGINYLTTAPEEANTDGDIKIVVLSSDPATKYAGYLYVITG